jgi:hypothetical protein
MEWIKINFSLRRNQPKVRQQPNQGKALETLNLETLGDQEKAKIGALLNFDFTHIVSMTL